MSKPVQVYILMGQSNAHYGGNAQTYMNVGEAMGKAMLDLLDNK